MNLLNPFSSRCRTLLLGAMLAILGLAGTPASAGRGAHGPNGEHLDAPASAGTSRNAVPGFEASSDAFELVGRLQRDGMSILINRFASNEPVLNATVEVDTGDLRAPAKFQAEVGDYFIDDARMLRALAAPGDHAVVVTVLVDNESDLLDGTLTIASTAANEPGHSDDGAPGHGTTRTLWAALALGAVGAIGWFVGRRAQAGGPSARGPAL
jgi:hypothetical protein